MEELVQQALGGDRHALEKLLTNVQGYVYNLAVRFLWHPADAQDATQEILVKLCTNLSKFNGDSKFTTWAYRVAINYLKNTKRGRIETRNITFSEFADDLASGFDPAGYEEADKDLLEEEVKIGCTTGMLLCLDRDLRLAYILGDILEVKSQEAGELLEITPELFRKRLQNARELIRAFMHTNCGLANTQNRCRCNNMIAPGIKRGIVEKKHLKFIGDAGALQGMKQEVEELHSIAGIYKSHPAYQVPGIVMEEIRAILSSGRLSITR